MQQTAALENFLSSRNGITGPTPLATSPGRSVPTEAMAPFLERAVYANNLGEEGDDRVKAAYGPNPPRLAAVKSDYDPANLFRLNDNVVPAPTG